jgi:hypothetical protein
MAHIPYPIGSDPNFSGPRVTEHEWLGSARIDQSSRCHAVLRLQTLAPAVRGITRQPCPNVAVPAWSQRSLTALWCVQVMEEKVTDATVDIKRGGAPTYHMYTKAEVAEAPLDTEWSSTCVSVSPRQVCKYCTDALHQNSLRHDTTADR